MTMMNDQFIAEQVAKVYRRPIPTIREYVTDPFYLGTLVTPVETQVRLLEKIFHPEAHYHIIALAMGIGWGKTFLVSTALSYMVYRVLCLRDPQKYYGLAPGSVISFVNFSVTGVQAKEVLFTHIRNLVDEAPCFQDEGFVRNKRIRSALKWQSRAVNVFSGTSESRSGIGYNVLGAAIDEASWFPPPSARIQKAGQVRTDMDPAQQLGDTILERMRSRGGQRWRRDSLLLAISSPRTVDDWIESLREANSPNVLFDRQPTWLGYPSIHLKGETFKDELCGDVPLEYKSSFETDVTRARRNLGAIPSQQIERYFNDSLALAGVYDDHLESIFDPEGPGLNYQYLDAKLANHQMTGTPMWENMAGRHVHIDLGLVRDRAGIVVGHSENAKVVFDGVTYACADDFTLGEVDFAWIRELLTELNKKYLMPISSVTYDGWQSADSRQQLRRQGFAADIMSVKLDSYDTAKELIQFGRVKMPRTARSQLFYQEASKLELIGGLRVDHPPNSTKDVTDSVVAICSRLCAGLGGIQLVRTLKVNERYQWGTADTIGEMPGGLADIKF